MIIPDSFPFGAFTVRVKRVGSRALGRGTAGDYCRQRGTPTIRLHADLEGNDLWDTFFHECGHMINDLVFSRGVGEETETQALGSAIHQLFNALGSNHATIQ